MAHKTYVQGKSIEEAMLISGMTDIIKLGSNENVLGPSPKALAAIQAVLPDLHLYPDSHENHFLDKLAQRLGYGLPKEHFITGNGSCDVLRMMTQTFIRSGKKALIAAPTFSMYELLVNMFHGTPVLVPLKDFTVDLEAVAAAVTPDVSMVFICNPNNPTGTTVTHAQVAEFLERLPHHVVTVFDEAYMEFVEDSQFPRMAEFIHAGHPILVTRTLSKLHGLASLRVGFGFGPLKLMQRVRHHQLHFNSGRLAYLAGSAAIEDEEHIRKSLDMVYEGRRFFYTALERIHIHYLPTQSNFIFLTDLPLDATYICDEAMKRGLILRPTGPFGLPANIRITIARPQDNQRVVDALEEILYDR
ncbi:MAG: pyridoxal phosphate-dependent aminotransferase [Chloroflexota bacterium]